MTGKQLCSQGHYRGKQGNENTGSVEVGTEVRRDLLASNRLRKGRSSSVPTAGPGERQEQEMQNKMIGDMAELWGLGGYSLSEVGAPLLQMQVGLTREREYKNKQRVV